MPLPNNHNATNREMINKIDNDITLLRGEVLRLTELVKVLLKDRKTEAEAKSKTTQSSWGLF